VAPTRTRRSALSERIAAGLHAAGSADANIAVYSPNDPKAFCARIGIFRAGGRWVPLNMRNPVPVNAVFLRTTKCSGLFFHRSLSELVKELRETVPTLRHLVCIEEPADAGVGTSLDEFIAKAQEPAPTFPCLREP
jgi:fatty-acyl-CoA synthase